MSRKKGNGATAYVGNTRKNRGCGFRHRRCFSSDQVRHQIQNAQSNLESAKLFLMENASKPGVVTTESGLQYIVVSKSNDRGKRPNMADVVEVHYKGSFDDGSEFDSTYRRGETADLALEEVIPGWKEALQLMREGDSFRIFLHPSLGYGEEGSPYGQVGSNQLLIFDIELITIR